MRSTTVGWLTSMLRTLPVTDDQRWLNKLRPELRESINHPAEPNSTAPKNNPTASASPTANLTEDRAVPGVISQDYHRTRAGRTLLSTQFGLVKVRHPEGPAFSPAGRGDLARSRSNLPPPESPQSPRASTPHGIPTTRLLRIKSSRPQLRHRHFRRPRRFFQRLGQQRRKRSYAPGRHLPRSRREFLRHCRRLFQGCVRRNPRQSHRRTPQQCFN